MLIRSLEKALCCQVLPTSLLSLRSRDFADSKYLLHYTQFLSDVLPDSHKRPYLIKVTSEWCFACIHIEPVWKEVVQELEPLGKTDFSSSSQRDFECLSPPQPEINSNNKSIYLKVKVLFIRETTSKCSVNT